MKQLNIIYIIISIVLTAAIAYFITRDTESEFIQREQQLLNEINNLNIEINTVRAAREMLDQDIIALNAEVDVLHDSISITELKIKKMKRYYDKKINDIDKYTTDDVARYFTGRYSE